ncbi:MAG: bifunctional phosphopantothenoylcysteine decarboxylase/phosphopantothenate--cysteine ligase CoaBC, partial [Dehalococcoidia bacterium]
MIPVLDKKHIVLGVTGSIACYKALDLASKLTQGGALVDVVMTQSATRFVTPLAFGGITHQPVVTDLFDPQSELSVEHVALAERADLLVVAPATANSIAKMALGLADDPLTTTLLATMAPVIVAPAMDGHMYENAAVQENLKKLRDRGVTIVGPDEGYLASGKMGKGRLVETPELMGHIRAILGKDGDLAGSTIVVSAGGTQEPLDPARIITNHSSGKMGYALAEAARDRGARTVLVTAPT